VNTNLTLVNLSIANTFSAQDGGAVGFGINVSTVPDPVKYPMQLVVNSCNFVNSIALNNGGAISFFASDYMNGTLDANCSYSPYITLIIQSSSFTNCTANMSSDPNDMESGYGGGASLLFDQSNTNGSFLYIADNVFTNCTATSFGGGLFIRGTHIGQQFGHYQLSVERCSFESCIAEWGGGVELLKVRPSAHADSPLTISSDSFSTM
jgi:hypothetical protein